ncbi:MAG: hypothetical protein WAO90_11985 [Mycobacterium sp.]
MTRTGIGRASTRRFALFGLALLIWALALIAIAVTVIPDAYWFSYYSVDYSLGFVRRGLAGELVGIFPEDHYFRALRFLRWLPTAFFVIGLAVLAWAVASTSGRSERRLMMALLVPLLPFGFAFGLFSARPDLFGASALIGFAVALNAVHKSRSVLIASAVYGITAAVLTLTHEAIPFLFGLGALSALAVLARQHHAKTLRASAILAVGPGLLTALAVAVMGRRGISAQLCELVPHGATNHPLAGNPSVGELLRGFRFDVDYHDWICRNITPLYDQSFGDATQFVASIGVVGLAASTALGIALLYVTVLAVSHVSGVPFGRMWAILRARSSWVLFGIALFLPVFMTGVDWTRWWVMIAFDIGIVFLLFASSGPEADMPPTRRTLTVFAIGAALLAALPLGIIPGFGAPVPM